MFANIIYFIDVKKNEVEASIKTTKDFSIIGISLITLHYD